MNREHKAILLVDFKKIDQEITSRAFSNIDIQSPLVILSSISDALNYLKNSQKPPPFLLLLSLNMPEMDGITFLKTLKRQELLMGVAVVLILDSKLDKKKIPEDINLGISDYIIKASDHLVMSEVAKIMEVYSVLIQKHSDKGQTDNGGDASI